MDVLIGCVVCFLLGAYIRKPFALTGKKSEEVKEEIRLKKEDEKKNREWERQFRNLMMYDGTKNGGIK